MKSGTYLVFRPHFKIVGKIVRASKLGVRCEYMSKGSEVIPDLPDIDIFTEDGGFRLKHISCKTLFDGLLVEHPSSFETRQCRLRFTNVSKWQAIMLDHFLQKYSMKPKKPKIRKPDKKVSSPPTTRKSNPQRCTQKKPTLG